MVLWSDGFIDPLRPQYTETLWAQVIFKTLDGVEFDMFAVFL